MIDNECIVKDGNEVLRRIAENVQLPISKNDLNLGKRMLKYLKMSQDEKLSKKYNLRSGVGLAAPQIGISKRIFAVYINDGEEMLQFVVFNPEIVAESVQMVFLGGNGEGCLSVPNKYGHVLRHKKIKIRGIWYDPIEKNIINEVRTFIDYTSIVTQHEYDHLNGILFIDKITNNFAGAEEIS